ncbi:aspartate--tRNA ligase [Phocaeicola barnesiae]|jgi:aspartyl-tRNA synthetase|uniref:Aspartate--tRNA ligase n=1 Tax=Phocaeicola barnesiae TaxID=376804 RepID=A0AAW5N315_9BACT|nr:aspartate--tRNA ligase [Phocaeicola barnesiae]MBS6468080.1 aspartate--tRNA ligase [Bacteroides sp.]CDD31412.1 aspartate--tRNA ligase [Bacteroides sp. CAG:714]MCF2598157.1 aspartate--tRNA ligase [Phocaeicola barnesiae]MCR8874921.1 aspartate--tRNA ligase [Phocaeicola barnesiae]MDM8233114.1 aspartate--tRNA ligase [Phocaeicola barnesiae]
MFRSHTCGELRLADAGKNVTLSGWVQRTRKMGGMTFVDLRDRYGITQLVFNTDVNAELCERANHLGREFVIQVKGTVSERSSKNSNLPTGDIEIIVSELNILNTAQTPPFTIEDNTDGGDDLRMKYRYLDLRRTAVRKNLELRHRMTMEVRRYLDSKGFLEVETPMLIGSTPEGARDFVVPSRMNPGQFYALPQSPQTLKQLLMVSGFDRYFQIVKCFRDEDLRADRQPEFTQIDCEMSFVEQEDIINMFEGMAKHLFKELRGVELTEPFQRMPWSDAMKYYGSDKPDLRFGMKFVELMDILKGYGFSVFDGAAYIGGICAEGAAHYTRKQIDQLTDFVKRPQIGAKGLVYARVEEDGHVKSSVDKFYSQEVLQQMKEAFGAKPGDLILILSGDDAMKTRKQLCELRLEMGNQLGLRDKNKFACLWVVDFPMFEWSEEEGRLMAMHHPFTHPKDEDIPLLDTDPAAVRADAYDMVVNGVEVGGGSIRIHDSQLQAKMFEILGFTPEKAQEQFGFLMNAFKFGAPPHGGLAYGLDRWVSLFAGLDSIRDCIAFPKNNSGRDVMLDAPGYLDQKQLDELNLVVDIKEDK